MSGAGDRAGRPPRADVLVELQRRIAEVGPGAAPPSDVGLPTTQPSAEPSAEGPNEDDPPQAARRAVGASDDGLPEGGAAAMRYLIRSTSQRPLTCEEAADKLRSREHPEAVVTAVVERARAARILDDGAFADAWVNDRGINRGYGRVRLRRELRGRKVPEAIVDAALAQLDDHDEVAQATDLARARAQRMPASLEPAKVAGRLVGFLVRRGYRSDIAHQVARRVTALDRDWD